MNISRISFLPYALLCLALPHLASAQSSAPFIGRWALTIPGGAAGWLGITQEDGYLDGSILWGGGSVLPLESVYVYGNTLYATRVRDVERKNKAGEVVRVHKFTETIMATRKGKDELALVQYRPRIDGQGVHKREFTAKLIPPLPPAPDLSKVKYGDAIELFNGKNLDGWRLTNERQKSGWFMKDGVLINEPKQTEGRAHIYYGNLRTDDEFEDFNLTTGVMVTKDGNSGVYLRGIYEVQVMDSYGRERDSHHMGAIYSRIAPSATVEGPVGEWQTLDITLWKRHVTVKLNGTIIIDNQPLLGCTGGALTSDEFKPGPIYLQGDHTGVRYRNMVLRPIVN